MALVWSSPQPAYEWVSSDGQTKVRAAPSSRGPTGPRGLPGPGAAELLGQSSSIRALLPARKALESGSASIAVLGDSNTLGVGASSLSKTWPDLLLADMRAIYAPSGDEGSGYLPAGPEWFAPTYGGAAKGAATGNGLDRRGVALKATGEYVEWSVVGSTIKVFYVASYFTRGVMKVTVDGTDRGLIDTQQAGSHEPGKTFEVTGLAAAAHTVRVSWVSGTPEVSGVFGTTGKGVTLWRGGCSGSNAKDWGSADWWARTLSQTSADLVVFGIGGNDQGGWDWWPLNPDGQAPDGEFFAHWLRVAVDKIHAAAPGASVIVLLGAQRRLDAQAGDYGKIAEYEAAAMEALRDDPLVRVLPESMLWAPGPAGEDPAGWLADDIHRSDYGNALVAEAVGELLTRDGAAVAAAQAAQAAAQSAAQSVADAATGAVSQIRSAIGEEITSQVGTDGTPAHTALVDALGTMGDPSTAAIMANPDSVTVRRSGTLTPATIDHAGLQAALDSAATLGLCVVAGGAYTTDQTLTIRSDCDLSRLLITYTGAGVAVRGGSESGVTWRLDSVFPRVVAGKKSGAGWEPVAGTVGIDLVNLNSCSRIVIPHVRNFETGLLCRGVGTGLAYNNVFLGHLENNKVNQRLTADETGWSNQNTYYGGQLSHFISEGVRVAAARHIQIDAGLVSAVNTNTWVGTSIEGDTPEYHVAFAGQSNVMLNVRWEVQGGNRPRVLWQNGAVRNTILFGYMSQEIVETIGTGTYGNQIITGQGWKAVGSSPKPLVVLENQGSSDYGSLAVLDAGQSNANADPATAYSWFISGRKLAGKKPTDTYDRLLLNPQTGTVLVGAGTAQPTVGIRSAVGATGVSWAGSFVLTADATYSLGTSAARWLDAHISRDVNAGRYVRVGSLTLRDSGGALQVSANGGSTWKTVTVS